VRNDCLEGTGFGLTGEVRCSGLAGKIFQGAKTSGDAIWGRHCKLNAQSHWFWQLREV